MTVGMGSRRNSGNGIASAFVLSSLLRLPRLCEIIAVIKSIRYSYMCGAAVDIVMMESCTHSPFARFASRQPCFRPAVKSKIDLEITQTSCPDYANSRVN